jgi:phage tail protein X
MSKLEKYLGFPLSAVVALISFSQANAYGEEFIVREVRGGDTLYRMCVQQYGSCPARMLQSVRNANPGLKNPDLIRKGERLRFPLVAGVPKKALPSESALVPVSSETGKGLETVPPGAGKGLDSVPSGTGKGVTTGQPASEGALLPVQSGAGKAPLPSGSDSAQVPSGTEGALMSPGTDSALVPVPGEQEAVPALINKAAASAAAAQVERLPGVGPSAQSGPGGISPVAQPGATFPGGAGNTQAPVGGKSAIYHLYPNVLVGEITQLNWLSDNTALITGLVNRPAEDGSIYSFVVAVDGDLDYSQDLRMGGDGKFIALVSIGRAFADYGKSFTLKLVRELENAPASQIAVRVIKEKNRAELLTFNSRQKFEPITGTAGIDKWLKAQSVDSGQLDNNRFKGSGGLVVRNYSFVSNNPDEKYLGRYGRVTLYGSSIIAKYLVLKGDTATAKKILDVWCGLLDASAGVPRSANVIGDTYISPDVRTGDMAHLLGALALYKAATDSSEYDQTILKLVKKYFQPLQDPETGLVRGGYSSGGNGYTDSGGVKYVTWASAEHNFDLFQALVLLSRLVSGDDRPLVREFYTRIGQGLDRFMWDKESSTFNRGYRFAQGPDKAKALDCSSWGALYLLKQAALAAEAGDRGREDFYRGRAGTALNFVDKNYQATWCYQSPDGRQGCISGYKPYAGKIDDVQDDATHIPIDWDQVSDLVWSEGTLGVAIANYQMWCKKPGGMDSKRCERFYDSLDQMLELQSLGQTGGLLYTSKRVEGHFTQGEELASLAWLGYALIIKGNDYAPGALKYKNWIPW